MTNEPIFLVFEGPDGVGKSRLSRALQEQLTRKGRKVELYSFPGKAESSLGRLVYELHHFPSRYQIGRIHPASLQTLHIAAHIDSIDNQIKPTLRNKTDVILDRYWWSTYVYGATGSLPYEFLRRVIDVEKFYWGNLIPDCIFLILRNEPFGSPMPAEEWRRIRSEYIRLAIQEACNRPHIVEVHNEGSIDDALNLIVDVATNLMSHGRERT